MPVLWKIDHISWMRGEFTAFARCVSLITYLTLHHPIMPVLCKTNVYISWMRGGFTAFARCVSLITYLTLHHPNCPFYAKLTIYLRWGVKSRPLRGVFDLLLIPLYITPKCPFHAKLTIYLGWGVNSRPSRCMFDLLLTPLYITLNDPFIENNDPAFYPKIGPHFLDWPWYHGLCWVCVLK